MLSLSKFGISTRFRLYSLRAPFFGKIKRDGYFLLPTYYIKICGNYSKRLLRREHRLLLKLVNLSETVSKLYFRYASIANLCV